MISQIRIIPHHHSSDVTTWGHDQIRPDAADLVAVGFFPSNQGCVSSKRFFGSILLLSKCTRIYIFMTFPIRNRTCPIRCWICMYMNLCIYIYSTWRNHSSLDFTVRHTSTFAGGVHTIFSAPYIHLIVSEGVWLFRESVCPRFAFRESPSNARKLFGQDILLCRLVKSPFFPCTKYTSCHDVMFVPW